MMSTKHRFDEDEAVRSTNDDASTCKRFAVQLGYWADPYLPLLVRGTERKTPEINRGYFARVNAITHIIQKFIKVTDGNCQIINFGAGFDTLFWKLHGQGFKIRRFVELDFPNVTSRKCYYLKNSPKLLEALQSDEEEVRYCTNELHSAAYHLTAADIRKLDEVELKLVKSSVDFELPTLFLFECVLVYMPLKQGQDLLKFIAQRFSNAVCVNYEQVNMVDRFGEVMLSNLRSRGCTLAGVEACASLESQENRFLENGWQGAQAMTMYHIYHSVIDPSEVHRIEKIEFLDEKELLDQLLQHYCICLAWKDTNNFSFHSLAFS